MAEPLAEPVDAEWRVPTWGLGDAVLGFVAGLAAVLVVSAIYFAVTGDETPSLAAQLVLQIPLWAGLLGVPLWAASTKGNGARRDLGLWMRWTDAPLGLAIGAALQLVVLPALYYPILRFTEINADDVSEPALNLTERAHGWSGVVLLLILVVVGAPIAEELFYRGLVLRSLEKRGVRTWLAVLLVAGWFALSHFGQFIQLPALLVFGVVAGALAARFGRLGPSIWTHVGFNLTSVVLLLIESSSR